mmetsp:Transcript_114376/g.323971  ORF Transcript_114376/g.323971 Transcript_114376/m.323971 type:complete len:491 (-) Transcript_114376:190-1662(-)
MGCGPSNNNKKNQARDVMMPSSVIIMPSGIDKTVIENEQEIRRVMYTAVEWRRKSQRKYACFVSHHKGQCGEVARLFHDRLGEMVKFKVCVSAGTLEDVDSSIEQVRNSDAVLVLLSEHVFTSPVCILEVKAAIELEIPIITVDVAHKNYGHGHARDFLQQLDTRLPQGALKDIEEFGRPHFPNPGALAPKYLAYQLSSTIPRIISVPIDLQTGSTNSIQASFLDLLKQLPEAKAPRIYLGFDDWKRNHKEIPRIPLLGERFPQLGSQKCTYAATLHTTSIDFNEFVQGHWGLLFSHPGAFTPVCTTELGQMAAAADEFHRRGVRLCGLSCDSAEQNTRWIRDVEQVTPGSSQITYPIICDEDRIVANKLGMVDTNHPDPKNLPIRGVFIIGPDGCIKFSSFYPVNTGRSTAELLRVVDSLQVAAEYDVATPANWRQGEACYVAPGAEDSKVSHLPHRVTAVKVPSGIDYLKKTDIPASTFPMKNTTCSV